MEYCADDGTLKTLIEVLIAETDSGTSYASDPEMIRKTNTTVSEDSFKVIQTWLDMCERNQCAAPHPPDAPLPTRLIEVRQYPRLVTSDTLARDAPYIALSHCWGLKPIFSLRQANLADLSGKIPVEKLPKTFRDAMHIAMRLGIKYLWIDSLCIIQDSTDDWLHEASRMQSVYSYCWLNLAATGFPDGSAGMIARRDKWHVSAWYGITGDYWRDDLERAPMNQRAWVLQERLLSPRTLHFGTKQIFWECRQGSGSEYQPNPAMMLVASIGSPVVGVKGKFWGTFTDSQEWTERYIGQWGELVSWYNQLHLTKE